MKHVILDTNFLLIPGELKVDIFGELDRVLDDKVELYVVDKTLDELDKLKSGRASKKKAAANLALGMIRLRHMKIICTNEKKHHVDRLILEEVEDSPREYIVATQDQAFKRKLKSRKVPHVVLRGKQYLEFINP